MTILPKKKTQKDKTESETLDPPPRSPPGESRVHSSRRQGSPPPRWNSPAPRDERLTLQDPGGRYEEPSTSHNKRRHRSSPHRTCRKHRHGERPSHHTTRPSWAESSPGASTSHASHPIHNHRAFIPPATVTSQEHNGEPEEEMGYNSGDEYVAPVPPPTAQTENIEELERCFEAALKEEKGLIIKKMGEDGACLFRAVADQVYGDQEMHSTVRKQCVDYMAQNADFYRQYVTEDFNTYIKRKGSDHCHGNHIEIQALSEIFNRPIEVYQYGTEPINTFHGAYKTDYEPIRLSYHGSVHYNSICDPFKATIGVGLGLPGFQPGLAEKNLMCDALRKSEDGFLEHTMLTDKLRETDWELTQEAIEEQVARESYIQWLCDQEKRKNMHSNSCSASAACSSSTSVAEPQGWGGESPHSSPRETAKKSRSSPGGGGSVQNSPVRSGGDALETLVPSPGSLAPPVFVGRSSPHPAELHTEVPGGSVSPKPSTSQLGAVGGQPGDFSETSSLMNSINLAMYGLSDWQEEDVLSQVMAQSEQEYLNKLKKQTLPQPPHPQQQTMKGTGHGKSRDSGSVGAGQGEPLTGACGTDSSTRSLHMSLNAAYEENEASDSSSSSSGSKNS